MRMSQHLGETLRAAPGGVEVVSHQLLLRAGYIRQLATGIFSYLPLGFRAMHKIEGIIRKEMDGIGGQEISMPVVHPAELWQETGRWYEIGDEMARFKDRAGRDMVLSMTHEEVVADLVRRDVHSYRQLPMLVYQIQIKFRDEPRSRAGLIRVREFTMKDSYSLDMDQAGLEQQYRNHYIAYFRIFDRAGLTDVLAVKSDPGMMGGKVAHEFMFLNPIGEDTLVLCDNCGDAANLQVARFRKPEVSPEGLLPIEKVATPGAQTIQAVTEFLDIPESRTAKVVFFSAAVPTQASDEESIGVSHTSAYDTEEESRLTREVLVMALVRGDMDVNETKLSNSIQAHWLKPADADMIQAVGAEPGYASPIGVARETVIAVVDDLVAVSPNLVSGANEAGFHYRNVNVGRDYQADIVTDITVAAAEAPCLYCGLPLRWVRGVEVGNIFQLGTRYTASLGANYLDAEGQAQPVIMGSYGIGVGRLLACIAEACHDERGLKLPITVAPYDLYMIRLSKRNDTSLDTQADELYNALQGSGIQVLYDERDASAGVKFTDADLIGIPLRVTISSHSLKNGGIELKRRDSEETRIIPLDDAVDTVHNAIAQLYAEAAERVVTVSYPEAEASGE